MTWRTVKASRKDKKITLEFFEEGWYTPKRRLHQVTIEEKKLLEGLRGVGLDIRDAASLAELDQAVLANEIAWYDTLRNLKGGTPDTEKQRDRLWSRITRKLGLQ